MREWIAQRRANAQTMVQPEGSTEWKALNTCPEFATVLAAPPPATATTTAAAIEDNPMSKVVPYKTPKALVAYYCGIFSLIPCVGLVPGIAAFILGILGLKAANAQPNAHGKVHAWSGIILGGLCAAGNVIAIVLMIVSANARH